jgi:hypothetical protein
MNDSSARAPMHFWIVGIFALVWNGLGALDYVMTSIRDPGYIARYPAEAVQLLDALPDWILVIWPLGIAGALGGSILLLRRSRQAIAAFALSLATLAAETVHFATTGLPAVLRTGAMAGAALAIWAVALGLFGYAVAMLRRRVLR